MRKKELKKLWFHTIIFIVLSLLILGVFGFFRKEGGVIKIISTLAGSIVLPLFSIAYSRFMLKWFRKMKAQNKSGDWDYLIWRWSSILLFGIILLILVTGGIIVGLGIELYQWVNN